MREKTRVNSRLIVLIICLVAAMFSVVYLGARFTKPESYAAITESLEEKKVNVEKLAGSAAAASAAITLMPGDFGTPIADKLADLSGYFLLILCTIYIEKFLVSLTGLVVFDFLLPIGFVLLGIAGYIRYPIRRAALKIIALSVVLAFLVPASVQVSNVVEAQYNAEIQQTIADANTNSESIQGISDQADEDNASIWSAFIDRVKGGSTTLLNKLRDILNNFIDALAIYIVTSCVIPVLCLILGIWLIKIVFHLDLPTPTLVKGSDLTKAVCNRRVKLDKSDIND